LVLAAWAASSGDLRRDLWLPLTARWTGHQRLRLASVFARKLSIKSGTIG
jgi:hypothetical protein